MASTAQSRIKSISYAKYGYMFIAPFFLVYAFFQVWPLINTFLLSFHGNGGDNQPFVGLENYQTLLFGGDDRRTRAFNVQFFQAFKNTIILWIGNFIPQIFLSLLLAVWFTDSKLHIPGKGAFKVIMYLPNIITAVSVAALFMRFMSNTDTCAANTILGMMGKDTIKFENDPTWSRGIVMFIQTWLWFGNTMIMMMSGIMGINPSLFEAANIDGATSGQILRKITLPLLRPMIGTISVMAANYGLLLYNEIALITSGGPDNATYSLSYYIYKTSLGSTKLNFARGNTAGVIQFILGIVIVCLINRAFRSDTSD